MPRTKFSTDRPDLRLVNYDVERPPYVPRVDVPRDIDRDFEFIVGLMMDITTERADDGPIGMHFYNRMCQRNWNNQEFDRECQQAAAFINMVLLESKQRLDPDKAIPKIVGEYLTMRTAFEVELDEGLWEFIDRRDEHNVEKLCGDFQNLLDNLDDYYDDGRNSRGRGGRDDRDRGGRGRDDRGNSRNQRGDRGRDYGSGSGSGSGGGRVYNTGENSRAEPVRDRDNDRQERGGRGYSRGGRDERDNEPQRDNQPTQRAPVGQTNTSKGDTSMSKSSDSKLVTADSVKWNPSEELRYPLVYNPLQYRMMYQIEQGKTIPNPVPLNADEMSQIDFNRHNITTFFGKPVLGTKVVADNTDIMETMEQDLRTAREEESNVDEQNMRVDEIFGTRAISASMSLTSAIHGGRMDYLAHAAKNQFLPKLFQTYVQINVPVITYGADYPKIDNTVMSENNMLAKFADSGSYLELREKLKTNAGNISLELMAELDLRMTNLMNQLLTKHLSISPEELRVTSFMQDLDDLLGLLKNGYSQRMHEAFLTEQAYHIKATLGFHEVAVESGKAVHDQLVQDLMPESWAGVSEGKLPTITFVNSIYRLTFLDVISHDLQLTGMTDIGNVITRSMAGELYSLAEAIFEADNKGSYVAHHYLITRDNRILELTKGYLTPTASYLISLVK